MGSGKKKFGFVEGGKIWKKKKKIPRIASPWSWKDWTHWLSVQSAMAILKIILQLKVGAVMLHFSHL